MRPVIYLALLTAAVAVSVPQVHSWEVPMQSSIASPAPAAEVTPSWVKDFAAKLEKELVAKYGEPQRTRVQRGLHQIAEFWRSEDGDAATFEDFVRTNFAGDQATLDTMFNRGVCWNNLAATRMRSTGSSASNQISTSARCFHSTKLLAATILPPTCWMISFRTNLRSWCC